MVGHPSHGPRYVRATKMPVKISPQIFLTFDDGPHVAFTPSILDTLYAHKVRATFFVLGSKLTSEAAFRILERMNEEGHTIGNHGFSHRDLTLCAERTIRSEILSTEKRLLSFSAFRRIFRPPYGKLNEKVSATALDLGYAVHLWNNDPRDWAPDGKPDKWVSNALSAARQRGARTILCHDIHRTTAENLHQLIRALLDDKYSFRALGGRGRLTSI